MSLHHAITAARRFGSASLLFLAALLISLLPGAAVASLQYDRAQIRAGDVYRLLTCHWTHWNADHLAWDAAAFFLLAVACECRSRWRFLATLAIAAIVVPAGLFVFQPEMLRYRGLSALASALFAFLAVDVARDKAHAGQWAWFFAIGAIALGFVIKIGIEIHYGTAVFVENSSDFVPVPLAHLLGACCGLAASIPVAKLTKSSRPLRSRSAHRNRSTAPLPRSSSPGGSREDFTEYARDFLPLGHIRHEHACWARRTCCAHATRRWHGALTAR